MKTSEGLVQNKAVSQCLTYVDIGTANTECFTEITH